MFFALMCGTPYLVRRIVAFRTFARFVPLPPLAGFAVGSAGAAAAGAGLASSATRTPSSETHPQNLGHGPILVRRAGAPMGSMLGS